MDHQTRDGYLNNISDIGLDDFADTDYSSYRASMLWDITDRLENYTIVKYIDSSNNGSPYTIFDCNPSGSLGGFCQGDLDKRRANGDDGEYDVYNFVPHSESEVESAQIINTTTWRVSDKLTVKNILSYADFESRQNMALYGTDWRFPPPETPTGSPCSFRW